MLCAAYEGTEAWGHDLRGLAAESKPWPIASKKSGTRAL